jgi:hypothetical protein
VNAIVAENQRLGTTAWRNSHAKVDANQRSLGIEGYCSMTSVTAGEKIDIFVNSEAPFMLDIYRMGFYGGAGARHIQQLGYFPGAKHAEPPILNMQLRECNWPPSVTPQRRLRLGDSQVNTLLG